MVHAEKPSTGAAVRRDRCNRFRLSASDERYVEIAHRHQAEELSSVRVEDLVSVRWIDGTRPDLLQALPFPLLGERHALREEKAHAEVVVHREPAAAPL